jgi:uridylate kinase
MSDPPQPTSKFRRVLLKLSGNSFALPGDRGVNMKKAVEVARQVHEAKQLGCQLAIVIGGGNILRGAQFKTQDASVVESTAHYMGMLATVINGLAFQDALESIGAQTRLMTAIRMESDAEPFIRRRALRHLEKGRIVILAGGTGRPFVTTDTAAAQMALELDAEILMKATRVDGVFSDDPEKNPHAEFYPELTFDSVLTRNLRVMDGTAISQCREHKLPVLVFNYLKEGAIVQAVGGKKIGTLIGGKK